WIASPARGCRIARRRNGSRRSATCIFFMADVEIPESGAEGMIVTADGRFDGYRPVLCKRAGPSRITRWVNGEERAPWSEQRTQRIAVVLDSGVKLFD